MGLWPLDFIFFLYIIGLWLNPPSLAVGWQVWGAENVMGHLGTAANKQGLVLAETLPKWAIRVKRSVFVHGVRRAYRLTLRVDVSRGCYPQRLRSAEIGR